MLIQKSCKNLILFLCAKMLIFSLLPLGFQECLKIFQLCDYCNK